MPLYELRCNNCDLVIEKLVRSPEDFRCPNCGNPMERTLSGFSIRMKEGYPRWVDNLDTYQKKQADQGLEPDLPGFNKIK